MNSVLKVIAFGITLLGLTSCATIVGGSRYIARVIVPNRPNATIKYQGIILGSGTATMKVHRSKANAFSVSVKEDGYNEQTFNFSQRTFRGWAFFGTIVVWTGAAGSIPLPWGAVVDLSTGALWKPNINEKGVSKMDHKNYIYSLDYKAEKSNVVVQK